MNNNPAKLAHLRAPKFNGSWWNRSKSMTTTMRVGKYTPINYWDVPGPSLFKLKNSVRMESLPAVSPLYGGFQLVTKYIFAPYRLYIPKLRKNQHLRTNEFPNLKLPTLKVSTVGVYGSDAPDAVGWFSFAGSLFERLGLGWGCVTLGQSFAPNNPFQDVLGGTNYVDMQFQVGLTPFLVYLDSWLHGEYNPQDVRIPLDTDLLSDEEGREYSFKWVHYQDLIAFMNVFAFGDEPIFPEGNDDYIGQFDRPNNSVELFLDESRVDIIPGYDLFTSVSSVVSLTRYIQDNYKFLRNTVSGVGLLPVTYKGDYFSSWFSEAGINNIKSFIVDSGMSLLSLRKENADMLVAALQMVAGDKYTDILQWQYDSFIELKDHPILIGKDVLSFGMQDVMNTTGSPTTDPLGQAGSKSRVYNHDINRPVSVKTKEPGMVMVCSYIIPSVVYYQGTNRFLFKTAVEDLWKPQYDAKGFQDTLRGEIFNPFIMPIVLEHGYNDLPVGQNYPIPFTDLNNIALSYVPLGWEYMTDYDEISGAMRSDSYRTWTLRREVDIDGFFNDDLFLNNYLQDSGVERLRSTYMLSWLFNDNFANVSKAEAENFILKYDFRVSCYQPMSHQLITKNV